MPITSTAELEAIPVGEQVAIGADGHEITWLRTAEGLVHDGTVLELGYFTGAVENRQVKRATESGIPQPGSIRAGRGPTPNTWYILADEALPADGTDQRPHYFAVNSRQGVPISMNHVRHAHRDFGSDYPVRVGDDRPAWVGLMVQTAQDRLTMWRAALHPVTPPAPVEVPAIPQGLVDALHEWMAEEYRDHSDMRQILVDHGIAPTLNVSVDVTISGTAHLDTSEAARRLLGGDDHVQIEDYEEGSVDWRRDVTITKNTITDCACDQVTREDLEAFLPPNPGEWDWSSHCNAGNCENE